MYRTFLPLLVLSACASATSPEEAPTAASIDDPRLALLAEIASDHLDRVAEADPQDALERRALRVELNEALQAAFTEEELAELMPQTRRDLADTPRIRKEIGREDGPVIDDGLLWENDVPEGDDPVLQWAALGSIWTDGYARWCFEDHTADLRNVTQESAFRRAADQWALHSSMVFDETSTCSAARIRVRFRTGAHGASGHQAFDGTGGILAHAFAPGSGVGGNIHFDDDETWTTGDRSSSSQPIDFESVALHELGHAIGLDHSSDSAAVMFSTYSGSLNELTMDDIEGVQALYGTDDCDESYASSETAWGYTGLAKLFAGLAASGGGAAEVTADALWADALAEAEDRMDEAAEVAIEGSGTALGYDLYFDALDTVDLIADARDASALSTNSWSGLAVAYGDLAGADMIDTANLALSCW